MSITLDTFDEAAVITLLQTRTYAEVESITGYSRGKIWSLAKKLGARKTEARIQERAAQRKQRQREELQDMLNRTIKMDVLDFLDGVPDEKVTMHFTSTPYNCGKKYGDGVSADNKTLVFYHGWLMQVISEMARTLKPGGVMCLNVGKTYDQDGNLLPLDVLLFDDIRKAGLTFQSRIVWTVPHGLTPAGRLAERYETILIFSKGDRPIFNANAARIPQKNPGKRAYKGPNKGELSGNAYGAAPTDVWGDIPNVRHNHPDRRFGAHPAQFPVLLPKRAILLYSMPGDLICDVFVGSGSTAVAAIETGRDFIGADLFYENQRDLRIAAARPDLFCPLPGVTDESLAVWQAAIQKVELKAVPVSNDEDRHACEQMEIFDGMRLV